MMLRYEDIHADPHGKLRQLVDFVGVEGVTDQLIADSVEHNRIESLRKREAAGQYQTSRLRPGDVRTRSRSRRVAARSAASSTTCAPRTSRR
ncbi:MAG: sulfotransferase domain-containing protein [Polyangiales bacterium]